MTVPPPARIGQRTEEVDTPALLLDLDVLQTNIGRMQSLADAAGVDLRPHAKSHKSADIARLQIDAGARGVCCQKVSRQNCSHRTASETFWSPIRLSEHR